MNGKTFPLIALAALLSSGAATLAQTGPAAADATREVRAPFEALRLSTELARAGEANRDPWALAIAARMRRLTPVNAVARAPLGGAEEAAEADPSAAWLQRAEDLGGDDPRLAALVSEVRSLAFKGRAGGPQVSRAKVAAGGSHRYGEPFESGRPAVVYIEGDGDTDLTLVVRGPDGVMACSEGGPGDVKLCAWTAVRGGRYAVEVSNRGRVANAYAFATN